MKKIILGISAVFILSGCSSNFFSLEDDPWKTENSGEYTEEEKHFETDKIIYAEDHATPSRPFIQNTSWKVTYIDGKKIKPSYHLNVNFRNNIYNKHDFLVSGSSGCNSYQGHLSLEIMEGKLKTDTRYKSTQHHCEDANLIAIEDQFLNVLFKNTNIEKNGENSIILEFRDKQFLLERF